MPERRSTFTLTFARSARRELGALDAPVSRRILSKIESLLLEPRPTGCLKLTGSSNLWRLRVGDWRVIYSIDDAAKAVDVIAIRHRSDAYR